MYLVLEDYIETRTKVLESETLAMTTIRSLDLERYPESGGKPETLAEEYGSPGHRCSEQS